MRFWSCRPRALAAPVLADGIGLGPDARHHALVGYGVADLPGQVGRVQAEETRALFDPSQHRSQSCDVGGIPVGDQVVYSDTPKFVPRKLHQAENFVDHLIL